MSIVSGIKSVGKLRLCIFLFVGICVLKIILEQRKLRSESGVTGRNQLTTTLPKKCKEKTNFVFIKSLKCAGTTMTGILRRFSYVRNLTMVLPSRWQKYLNFPYARLTPDFYLPSKKNHNVLIDHSVFAEQDLAALMPRDTVYISSIREPFAQIKSSFNFFAKHGLDKHTGIQQDEARVYRYLSDVDNYERRYQENKAKLFHCRPDGFSLHKNIMSHMLGMPLGFPAGAPDISSDDVAIQRYIQHIDAKFSLIMVVEYFYESLILLKRLMCWQFSDIVFVGVNVLQYKGKNGSDPQHVLDIHRRWSRADYLLYDYFNSTLWRRIEQQGDGFFQEVNTFQKVQLQVENYCAALNELENPKLSLPVYMRETVVDKTAWSDEFVVTSSDCWYMADPYRLMYMMQADRDVTDREAVDGQKRELPARQGKLKNCSRIVP